MFDGIIFGFLILSGVVLLHLWHGWKTSARKPLVGTFAALLLFAWTVVFYGSFIEPNILVTHETPVVLSSAVPDASETIRVAVISDMHLGPYHGEEWARRIVLAAMNAHPDLILLAGDFIAYGPEEAPLLTPLKELAAPLGVYAVLGNHDYAHEADEAVAAELEKGGITVLKNSSRVLSVGKKTLALVGLSDIWFAGDLPAALEGVSEDVPTILLAHNPDAVLLPEALRADLVVAGHTHGGQIRLPFLGPVPPIPDKLGRAYDRGLFSYKNQPLFITSGVGTTGPRARLYNPPVIDLLTLTF